MRYECKSYRQHRNVLFWSPLKTLRVSQVDFDAPLGYKEPERQPQHQEEPTVRTVPLLTNGCV